MKGIFDWYYSLSFLGKVAVGVCGGAAAYYLASLFFGSLFGELANSLELQASSHWVSR